MALCTCMDMSFMEEMELLVHRLVKGFYKLLRNISEIVFGKYLRFLLCKTFLSLRWFKLLWLSLPILACLFLLVVKKSLATPLPSRILR